MTETNRYRHFAHQRNTISTVTSSCVVCFWRKAFIACTLSLKPSESPHADWPLNCEGVLVLLSCYAPSRQEHGFCGSHWRHTFNFLTLGGLSPVMCIFFSACLRVSVWWTCLTQTSSQQLSDRFPLWLLMSWSHGQEAGSKPWPSGSELLLNMVEELMIKNALSTSGV